MSRPQSIFNRNASSSSAFCSCAFVSAIARKEIVVDEVEQATLLQDQPANTDDDKQTSRRWLHPDTQEAQKIRLKKKGKSEEE